MDSQLALHIWIGVLATAMVVGVTAAVLFSRDRRIKRRIRNAAPTTIAAATPGTLARLTGAIEPLGRRLSAPITGRECVYYLAILQVHRSSGRSSSWVEVAREEEGVDFLLRDATGAARVHMDDAQVAVVRDHHTRSGTFDDPTAIEAAFLERHDRTATNMFGLNLNYRYTEGVLEPGEQVGALGRIQEVDGQRELRRGLDVQVLVSDDPSTLARRAQSRPST